MLIFFNEHNAENPQKRKKVTFRSADAFTAFHKGGDKNGDKMEYRPYEQIIFLNDLGEVWK